MLHFRLESGGGELFEPFGDSSLAIPFISRPEWLFDVGVGSTSLPLVVVSNNSTPDFPISKGAIKRRKRLGQKLFNAPALYFRSIEVKGEAIQIQAGVCGYFEILSSLIRLENESYRASTSVLRVLGSPFRKLHFGEELGAF